MSLEEQVQYQFRRHSFGQWSYWFPYAKPDTLTILFTTSLPTPLSSQSEAMNDYVEVFISVSTIASMISLLEPDS